MAARSEVRGSFFFQAEDGIRDIGVTGVQTCALPIFAAAAAARSTAEQQYESERRKFQSGMSTAYMVSQRRIDLINARGRELQAQTDLNKSVADFRRATGSTLPAHNVALRPADPARKFELTNHPATEPAGSESDSFEKE